MPTGNAALDAALKGSSSLISLQKTHAVGPFALAGRIRDDRGRLEIALESFGYYGGSIDITVAGHPAADPDLPDILAALPAGQPAQVRIAVATGPLFHLGTVTVTLPPGESLSPADERAFDLHAGQPAVASDVLGGSTRLLTALQEEGHAFADVQPPLATLRPATRTLDIVVTAKLGPRVDIGRITLAGLRRANPGYVARLLEVHQGQLYQPSRIEAARQELASTGVFSDVGVTAAKQLAPDGELPLTFDFTEAKLHTVSLQAGYSTDLGGSAGVTWTHHDLFGNGERLDLTALLTGVGGTSENGLGYDVYADLLKPDFYDRDQTLDVRVEGLKQDLEAYDQTALLVRAVVNRKLSRLWTVSGGVGVEEERILQQGVSREYTLAFVPLSANYDSTGLANPLDDPTHGFRIALDATPSYSLGSGDGKRRRHQPGRRQLLRHPADDGLHLHRPAPDRARQARPQRDGAARHRRHRAGRHHLRAAARPAALCRRQRHRARLQVPGGGAAVPERRPGRRHGARCRHRRVPPAHRQDLRVRRLRRCRPGLVQQRPVPGHAQGRRRRGCPLLHPDRADPARRRGAAEQAAGRRQLRAIRRPGRSILRTRVRMPCAGDPTRPSALAEAHGQEAAPLRFSPDTPGVPPARHSRSAHPSLEREF